MGGLQEGETLSGDIALWTSLAAAGGAVLGSGVTGTITYFVTNRSIAAAKTEGDTTRRHEIEQAWAFDILGRADSGNLDFLP